MIKVIIADDEAPAREKLERWLSAVPDMDLLASAEDGLTALRSIESRHPDVVFLDVQMPICSGLEVAAQLEASTAPLIVFVTAFDAYAVRAFEFNAIDYLLKPYDRDRFLRSLQRIRARLDAHAGGAATVAACRAQMASCERLLIPVNEQLRLVDTAAIDWIEADDNYVQVHTRGETHLLRRTLQDLLLQLDSRQFVRVHKSAVVNLSRIRSLAPLFKGDYQIELLDGTAVRLSRRYREPLFTMLGR